MFLLFIRSYKLGSNKEIVFFARKIVGSVNEYLS